MGRCCPADDGGPSSKGKTGTGAPDGAEMSAEAAAALDEELEESGIHPSRRKNISSLCSILLFFLLPSAWMMDGEHSP